MVSKTGDWGKFEQLCTQLKGEVTKAVKQAQMVIGLKTVAIVKKHMQAQDLGWVPLSEAYKRGKIQGGYSEKILIRTSTMFQAITSTTQTVNGKQIVFAGILRARVDKNGEIIANIAAVHEYGSKSRGIPARPLWRPSLKETKEWVLATKPFNTTINKALTKYKK